MDQENSNNQEIKDRDDELFCDKALEDDLEIEADVENLPL
jgi:hypothetical protein